MGRRPCCSKELALNRGAWTALEDKMLSDYIRVHGEGKWRHLPERAGLKRCGKSCRLRWLNYLRPGIKRGSITEEEEDLIIRLHKLLGNRWALIAGRLPGRTDNEIKNYWHTKLSKTSTIKPHSTDDQSSPKSTSHQDQSLLEEPSLAKIQRVCESQRSLDGSKTTTVVRTKATRFTEPVTTVLQIEENHRALEKPDRISELFDDNRSSVSTAEIEPLAASQTKLEEQYCQALVSDFTMDFDVDQSFLAEFFNSTADWISELPYSDVEGNISSSRSDETLLFPSEEIELPRVGSDLESMASLIETDDHLDTLFQF